MQFPNEKRFVFTILDDTDDATVSNVEPIYSFLRDIGMLTTKTVWPVGCPEGSQEFFAAETLEDQDYLQFVHTLADAGFEIASHGATMESSKRARTLRGLELLRNEFGSYPRLYCNHGFNRENVYWGKGRFQSWPLRSIVRLTKRSGAAIFDGEDEHSPYFWGDRCLEHIKYVRNFTFRRLNMLRMNPGMPYRLRGTKFVKYWFSTSDAPDVDSFNRLVTRDRIDELEAQGGICIVSTHLGKGFVRDGELNSDTKSILEYIAQKPGWFVPVSDVLEYLIDTQGAGRELTGLDCLKLELQYIADKLFSRL